MSNLSGIIKSIRNDMREDPGISGDAFNLAGELQLLEIIRSVHQEHPSNLVSTCLAAHIKPSDQTGIPVRHRWAICCCKQPSWVLSKN